MRAALRTGAWTSSSGTTCQRFDGTSGSAATIVACSGGLRALGAAWNGRWQGLLAAAVWARRRRGLRRAAELGRINGVPEQGERVINCCVGVSSTEAIRSPSAFQAGQDPLPSQVAATIGRDVSQM